MRYSKPPLSIERQLTQLIDRGLGVTDEAAAMHWLRHVNYYRLRGYWLPLEDGYAPGAAHRFKAGATFDEVIGRYTFDRQLRLLVLDAIERIEVSLRACWAHALTMRHGSHAHEDARLFHDADLHARCLRDLQGELRRSKETFVLHYFATYDFPPNPPAWAACEVMTLGQLSKWLSNIRQRQDRQAIAAAYGLDEQVVCSFAHHLSYVRNVCAHHGRLYNRSFTVTVKLPRRPATLAASLHASAPRQLYNTLVLMKHMLDVASPGHSWTERLFALLEQRGGVTQGELGFPFDWRQRSIWL